jgi:RNA polymerase sigma-70 factor (ECF subfamily)
MRDITLNQLERFDALAGNADAVLQMDEEAFHGFYERTARPVWLYLARLTGDPAAADDLLQETYYRFLRVERPYASEAHRKNYLFRIATNLAHDRRRRHVDTSPLPEGEALDAPHAGADESARAAGRIDLHRALARLKPRERALLLLAYSQGSSHHEIAESLGLKTASVKALLFRARRRLASILAGAAVGQPPEAGRTPEVGRTFRSGAEKKS